MDGRTRRGPGGHPVLNQNIALDDDKAERTAVATIIAATRKQLGERHATDWNEVTRNRAEAHAWATGHLRICDLAAG